jgi:acyl dehydratase
MKGKTKALALIAMFLFVTPAFAGDCITAIAELDQKIAIANVAPEILNEVQIMRMQADQMCQAGDDATATEFALTAGALLAGQ